MDGCANHALALADRAGGADAGDGERDAGLLGEGRPDDREREAGIVLHRIVVQERPPEVLADEVRGVLKGLVNRELLVAATGLGRPEQVVHGEARRVQRAGGERWAIEREQEVLETDEVRRQAQEAGPLAERLADEVDLHLLQVPEAAVDQAAGAGRGSDGDVVLLHQRDPEAAADGIEERPGAHDPAPDDEQVPGLVGEPFEVGTAPGERRPGRVRGGLVGHVVPSGVG